MKNLLFYHCKTVILLHILADLGEVLEEADEVLGAAVAGPLVVRGRRLLLDLRAAVLLARVRDERLDGLPEELGQVALRRALALLHQVHGP